MATYRNNRRMDGAHGDGIWSACWLGGGSGGAGDSSSSGLRLATGGVDETVKLWSLPAPKAPDGEEKAAEEASATLTCEHELPDHHLGVVTVAASPAGNQLAVTSMDSVIRLWTAEGVSLGNDIEVEPVEAWSVAWNPLVDACQIATGSQSGRVNLWDTRSGEKTSALETHGKFVMSVAYTPDGKQLACGAQDGVVYVFDVASGALLNKLEGHTMPVRSLSFSADGTTLLSASDDGKVNLWDASSGAAGGASAKGLLAGHTNWVLSVAANPADANMVATGSSDKRVKLWDLRRRDCVQTFEAHTEPVWSVAYSPDGSLLASVGDDAAIQVYELQR